MAAAWFPADQWSEARRRWSDLRDPDLPADHAAYCRVMDGRFRAVALGQPLWVTPLTAEGLEAHAREHGSDPNTPEARSHYAAVLLQQGEAIPWPPNRNDPCWCGSERKYKRCCATA